VGRPALATIEVDTVDRLLQAAAEVFGATGFAVARLEDIAARAGIRRPSLLHHFPNKQALYDAAVGHAFDELGARLLRVMGKAVGVRTAVDELVRAFSRYLAARPEVAGLIVRELVAPAGAPRATLVAAILAQVRAVEAFLATHGRGVLRADVRLRPAIMTICSAILMRAAVGTARDTLWGRGDPAVALARALLFPPQEAR
jgi:AcrR family transcriptional regulator